jgi:UDP-N-acetylmuramate dehydrogenase
MTDLRLRLPDVTLLEDEPMAKYTSARLGGTADTVYIARQADDELFRVLLTAWKANIPVTILGGGANVLVSDKGIRGLTIINKLNDIRIDHDEVRVLSGVSLSVLAHKLQRSGLTGFEWAVGVPGTVGGAVVNNAGAHGRDAAANVTRVALFGHENALYSIPDDDLRFDYRTSILKQRRDRRFFIVDAVMRFEYDDPAAIQARMDENTAYRKRTQPPGASLGSIFKNPPGDYAGRLIESCGLKGFAIGGAQVSPVHANFFINTDIRQATATDYDALVRHVQTIVAEKTGVVLQPEIEWVGDW